MRFGSMCAVLWWTVVGSLTMSTRYGTFNWAPQGDAPREPTQCLSGAVTPFVVTGLSLAKQGASAWPGLPKRGSSRVLLVGDVGETLGSQVADERLQ